MLYVALAQAAAIAVVAVTFAALLRSRDRAHARKEDLLLNQLLHAIDKPWQEAPAVAVHRHAADVEQPRDEDLMYAGAEQYGDE